MSYERPPLVLAVGSLGGYKAFREVMESVDPKILRDGPGSIYFVEHLPRGLSGWMELAAVQMHFRRGLKKAAEGMKLERGGLYLQPDVYEEFGERDHILILGENGDGDGLRFLKKEPDGYRMGLSYSILGALDAGYRDGMMLVGLSGYGDDGSKALEGVRELEERGEGLPRIAIQQPDSAEVCQMPTCMISKAKFLNLPHDVLPPAGIGLEINLFLGPSYLSKSV